MNTLTKFFARPGATAGTVGALVALQLAAWRALTEATPASVSLMGRELGMACAFRSRFGVACPNCGMTRSVLLSLHGDVSQAFALNPAGPLLVLGTILFAAAMFLLMFTQRAGRAGRAARVRRAVILGAVAYGVAVLAVMLAHWVRQLT